MIYAVSDLHGQYNLFIELLKKINFSKEDEMYILGDIIDRGPNPIQLLQYIMDQDNIHVLLGNHEKMFLDAFYYSFTTYAYETRLWHSNGGQTTFAEYEPLPKGKQKDIIRYLEKLPLKYEITVNDKKYYLVHGSYSNVDDEDTMIWGRMAKSTKTPENTVVIFGHTPTIHYQNEIPYTIFKQENMINIDCGLARRQSRKSQLGCLCLNNLSETYVTYKTPD